MNSMEEINVFFKEKSGKKLFAFSGCVFLLITAIVFFASFTFCRDAQLELMDKGLGELPGIIEGRENELVMRSRAYEDDILTRAELGLKFYLEEDGLTDAEKLERLRDAVSAASVSLLDGQGQLLVSTGHVSPEEIFRTCIRTIEPRSAHLEFYPALSEDGEVTEENDGKGFVLLPVPGNTKRSLVFEFPCDSMLSLYNDLDDWSAILELLSGGEAAYARIGNRMAGYPLDGLTSEQTTRLFDELTKVFQKTDSFQRRENGSSSGIITLQGKRHLAALIQDPQDDADIMLTVPLKSVIGNGIYIALSISVVIGWGIMLFQIYVFHRLRQKETEKDADAASREWVRRTTRPGILVMLAFTVIFSFMLLLLESRTNVSLTAVAGREILQQEIDWREAQKNAIRSTYSDIYRSRSQTLADFLTERPDYQTHAGLEELSGIANADYLMRFDSTGQELLSSNSYTGFSIGNNLSGEYQAVLMGYPYAVAGPAADPYTGRMQLGTAILMTDAEGQPDGFLLAVYSAEELNAELERMSYENTVNNTSVRKGYAAAAISDEDGRFIAHTDPEMIGKKAEDSLPEYEPGSSFEGFTDYNGKSVCVSSSEANGKTLLFMVPERGDFGVRTGTVLAGLAVLLILVLLFYPNASVLIAQTMAEAEGKFQPPARPRSPLAVFFDGYSVFLTLFALFALISSAGGWWTSFDYVFSGEWSKGVHLFSIWAALFIVAATRCCEFLILTVLNRVESRLSLRAKTITRLANSFVVYSAGIFLFFSILSMFGVNTTALLASAGIVSIAVGMGAQGMASDLLAGFFMLMEGSVHVGDHVDVAGVNGYVTDMGIRNTEITDENGDVVILNNSMVSAVRNMSRNHTKPDADDNAKNAPENTSKNAPESES